MDAESAKRWAKAADLAAPLGLLTAAQLNALGIFRGPIEKGLRSGRLHRMHQGVYVLRHGPATREVRWATAVMACGREAVLSHRSHRMVCEARFRKLLHLPALELTHRRRPSRRLAAIIDDLLPTETPLEDLFVRAVVRRYSG